MDDIVKEDMDVITASGFEMRDISGPISKIVRDFVLERLRV